MYYQCPKCGSFIPPKVIRRYPPVVVVCKACGHQAEEPRFIHVGDPGMISPVDVIE